MLDIVCNANYQVQYIYIYMYIYIYVLNKTKIIGVHFRKKTISVFLLRNITFN